MAEVLQPYDFGKLNRTLTIDEASYQFQTAQGPALLKNDLLQLFAKYPRMVHTFCIVLVHHHFKLKAGQALVDVSGCSTAWDLETCPTTPDGGFEKYGGYVKPRSWLISNGKLIPFEFYFDSPVQGTSKSYVDFSAGFDYGFVEEFMSVVAAHGLSDILGLSLHATHKECMLELNEPGANITFPERIKDGSKLSFGEASWGYETLDADGNFHTSGPLRKLGCRTFTKYLKGGDGTHTSEESRKSNPYANMSSTYTE